MPTCDQQTNEDNQKKALAANPVVECHVVRVVITNRDTANGTITFIAPGRGASVTCTEKWGDASVMWAACPSSLPSAATAEDPGSLPAVGATGTLYLSVDCVQRNGILVDGPPKWPKNLPAKSYEMLSIWPMCVVVTGIELATGSWHRATFDVLDSDLAQPGQSLVLSAEPLELRLSQDAFKRFPVSFESPAPERAWPWTGLADAVVEISGAVPDPGRLATAWRVVAACVEQIEGAILSGLVTAQHLEDLRKVLPNHPAVKDVTL